MEPATWESQSRTLQFHALVKHPTTVDEVVSYVKDSQRVQVVGCGHSFQYPSGHIGSKSPDVVLDLTTSMGHVEAINFDSSTCTIGGGCTFATLISSLEAHGMGLENVPLELESSVVGCVLTGCHGCGRSHRILAELVLSMELVTGQGVVLELKESDRMSFVHLGLLGVVTRLTLRCVSSFHLEQRLYENVPLAVFGASFARLAQECYSISAWLDFREGSMCRVQLSQRCAESESMLSKLDNLTFSDGSFEACLPPARSTIGKWYDVLSSRHTDSSVPTPSVVQTEFFVPLSCAGDALEALRFLPCMDLLIEYGCEMQVILADAFALSPCSEHHFRNSHLHQNRIWASMSFSFQNDPERLHAALGAMEATLSRFDAVPHWGKLFRINGRRIAKLYDASQILACAEFWDSVLKLDPQGKFRNALFDQIARSRKDVENERSGGISKQNDTSEALSIDDVCLVCIITAVGIAGGLLIWRARRHM